MLALCGAQHGALGLAVTGEQSAEEWLRDGAAPSVHGLEVRAVDMAALVLPW